MSWEAGTQKIENPFKNINEELMKIEGNISDAEARVLMYKFFRENIGLFTEKMMGVKLLPFQEWFIKGAMLADYSMFVASRGSGKSFLNAILLATLMTMYNNIKIGVISASYRQAQIVFSKLEDILNDSKSELLKDCLVKKNQRYITKGNTSWKIQVMAPNHSEAIALPLTEKIRGYRFNVLIVDEMLLMPENLFEGTIMPMLTTVSNVHERKEIREIETELIRKGKIKESERIKWPSNKLIMTSSASYSFEYLAKLYNRYKNLILEGKDENGKADSEAAKNRGNYFILHMSYEALPPELYDSGIIGQSLNTMSESNFRREFMSEFVDDSSGFFKLKDMIDCSYQPGEGGYSVEIKGDEGAQYFVAFDSNLGTSETNDHFAIHVFRLDMENKQAVLVHSRALAGLSLKEHTAYMHYLFTNFNIIGGIGDSAGGGERFVQACNESSEFKLSEIKLRAIHTKDNKEYNEFTQMDRIYRQFKKDIILGDNMGIILRVPDTGWIAHANDLLQSSFNHQKIRFAAPPFDDAEREGQMRKKIENIGGLSFLQNGHPKNQSDFERQMDLLENQAMMIELTKRECAMIQPSSNANGTRSFDLPSNIKRESGKDRSRKDSYSALVLGNWFAHLYFNSLAAKTQDNLADFVPYLI